MVAEDIGRLCEKYLTAPWIDPLSRFLCHDANTECGSTSFTKPAFPPPPTDSLSLQRPLLVILSCRLRFVKQHISIASVQSTTVAFSTAISNMTYTIESHTFPLLVCQASAFDAIVTVFFLDTAPVVMEYIEAIAR